VAPRRCWRWPKRCASWDAPRGVADLERLIREYDSVKVIPTPCCFRAAAGRQDRWKDALATYRELKVEYPISLAALRTHLEIAEHYLRVGNDYARMEALEQARRAYREFLDRYPENPSRTTRGSC